MINITKFGNFKDFETNKNKKQIILCNSFRSELPYLNSLKYRNNGKYKKVPNYFITREGKIVSLLTDDSFSDFFSDYDVNKNSIIISLENLGWVQKVPLNLDYFSWIGEKLSGEVYERKWRDKMFWQNYTKEQLDSLVELCEKLTKKFSISKTFIGHNTKVDGIKIFNGIVCRSNYNNKFTDPSPSFKFEEFKNRIENERD
jgi:N-acetyl-anhydromuramyl-L-alanine amidase AmpD